MNRNCSSWDTPNPEGEVVEQADYSNFANNLFASSCDNLRPTISFATFHLPSSSLAPASSWLGLFPFHGSNKSLA